MKKPAKKRPRRKAGPPHYATAPHELGTKPRRPKEFTLRIATFRLESASLVFVARDPKGKELFRYTMGISEVEGL